MTRLDVDRAIIVCIPPATARGRCQVPDFHQLESASFAWRMESAFRIDAGATE
jgi:hypothetical protein